MRKMIHLLWKIKCDEERCTPSKAGELPPSVSTLQSVKKEKRILSADRLENRQANYLR